MSAPVSSSPRCGRAGSNLLIGVGCLAAMLAFPSRPDPVPATPLPAAHHPPDSTRLAAPLARPAPANLDPDGVQRRLAAAGGRQVALTSDDGPDPRWTPAVLDLLRRYRVHATFGLVGVHVAGHPELVRRIVAGGHQLCDHSWSHDEGLPRRSAAIVQPSPTSAPTRSQTTTNSVPTACAGLRRPRPG